jgi:hypothetical protein
MNDNNSAIVDLRSPKRKGTPYLAGQWTETRISHPDAATADANRREFFAAKAALQAEIQQAEKMRMDLRGAAPEMDAHIRDLKARLAALRIKS